MQRDQWMLFIFTTNTKSYKQYYKSQQQHTSHCWRCGWGSVCGGACNHSHTDLCFLLQTSNQIRKRRRRSRFVGLFILAFYVSKLIFYSRVKISSPFSSRKTCQRCQISSFENQNLERKKNIQLCNHQCLIFHHIDKALKTKLDLLFVIL